MVNAVEAVADRGSVRLTGSLGQDKVRLSVADTGGGISSEIEPHIFELFFTTKDKGSGVGLAQVHVFCDTHGGSVFLESSSKGATFVIELPVATGSEDES